VRGPPRPAGVFDRAVFLGHRDEVVLRLLLDTDVRVSELWGLELTDIGLESRPRVVPFGAKVVDQSGATAEQEIKGFADRAEPSLARSPGGPPVGPSLSGVDDLALADADEQPANCPPFVHRADRGG
jgi:hypothetical protein